MARLTVRLKQDLPVMVGVAAATAALFAFAVWSARRRRLPFNRRQCAKHVRRSNHNGGTRYVPRSFTGKGQRAGHARYNAKACCRNCVYRVLYFL